jgi:hypothetical protein
VGVSRNNSNDFEFWLEPTEFLKVSDGVPQKLIQPSTCDEFIIITFFKTFLLFLQSVYYNSFLNFCLARHIVPLRFYPHHNFSPLYLTFKTWTRAQLKLSDAFSDIGGYPSAFLFYRAGLPHTLKAKRKPGRINTRLSRPANTKVCPFDLPLQIWFYRVSFRLSSISSVYPPSLTF